LVWGCIRRQRCVAQKICADVTFDLDPVTLTQNCVIFHFRSIIPKWPKIFGWYLVGGYIRGQRCVARKNRLDATFALDPVTFKPKFPSALHLLNEWRFLVDIWYVDVSGQKGVSCERLVLMRPLTLTPNCIIFLFRSIIPKRLKIFGWYLVGGYIRGQRCVARKNCVDATFDIDPVTFKPNFPSALYLLNEWRFLVVIWCEDVSGDKGVSGNRFVSMWPLTLTQWPWPQIA
jgi:hypothetical protein